MMYTKEDLPDLFESLEEMRDEARKVDIRNDHKLQYSNAPAREVRRIEKLIQLINHDLSIYDYGSGMVIINDKFVVSLISNKWRIRGRNKWYMHKHDTSHFVNNYILRDEE